MFHVMSLIDTLRLINENFLPSPRQCTMQQLDRCGGLILAQDICAQEDNPWFVRSTVDGYAVKSADTFGANASFPAMLSLIGKVEMGEKCPFTLQSGQCAYVSTGGYVPDGADSVVMLEHCDLIQGELLCHHAVSPGTNVIFRGDDAKKGGVVLSKDTVITAKEIAALAVLGISDVPVWQPLRCAIISTGDELVPVDTRIEEMGAVVRDANSHFLAQLVRKWGGKPVCFGIIKDDPVCLQEICRQALETCDLVLISGGSSVGAKDTTTQVIEQIEDTKLLLHGIAVKPGKPTIIAKCGYKALVGLPGHPVSAFFIMQQVVEPLYQALCGIKPMPKPFVTARVSTNIPSNHGRDEFVPVVLKQQQGQLWAQAMPLKSGLIALLSQSDGYIHIKRESEGLDMGSLVQVYPL